VYELQSLEVESADVLQLQLRDAQNEIMHLKHKLKDANNQSLSACLSTNASAAIYQYRQLSWIEPSDLLHLSLLLLLRNIKHQ
jgi:hypothetical protein